MFGRMPEIALKTVTWVFANLRVTSPIKGLRYENYPKEGTRPVNHVKLCHRFTFLDCRNFSNTNPSRLIDPCTSCPRKKRDFTLASDVFRLRMKPTGAAKMSFMPVQRAAWLQISHSWLKQSKATGLIKATSALASHERTNSGPGGILL